jgi:histidine triad (HIT) family protein
VTERDCLVCRKQAGELPTPGGPIYADELVYASHVFDLAGSAKDSYLGHLVVEPRRHAPGLADLTAEEAGAVVARSRCSPARLSRARAPSTSTAR